MTTFPDEDTVPSDGLQCPMALATAFRDEAAGSWLLQLPGLWGADRLMGRLAAGGPVVKVDGSVGPVPSQVLDADEHLDAAEHAAGRAPLAVFWPQLLDDDELELLARRIRGGRRTLVVVRSDHDTPPPLAALVRAGQLRPMTPRPLTSRALGTELRRRLDGPHSARLARRLHDLAGGQPVVLDRLLGHGRDRGVVVRENGLWRWLGGDEALDDALDDEAEVLLLGFTADERRLLALVAAAGWVPEEHLDAEHGGAALESLAAQRIIGTETAAESGHLDVTIPMTAVRTAVGARMRPAEELHLWFAEGRRLGARPCGLRAEAAHRRWKIRAEGPAEAEELEELARRALAASWYRTVVETVALAERPTGTLQALGARADHMLGDVGSALRRLSAVPEDAADDELREALLVAERIRLFHPELAAPVVAALRDRADGEPLVPVLDHMLARLQHEDPGDELLDEVQALYTAPSGDEPPLSMLCAGAQLAFTHRVDLGREILTTLVDVLRRERRSPDLEDCARAMLRTLRALSDWRLDARSLEVDLLTEEASPSRAQAGVVDLTLALAALQDDRMDLAFRHAHSAVRIFDDGDSFGLLRFARGLASLLSALSTRQSGAAEQGYPRSSPATEGDLSAGLPWLRLLADAHYATAVESTEEHLRSRVEQLTDEAIRTGEVLQAQLLLLLSLMLRRSPSAGRLARQVLERNVPGSPQLLPLLAQDSTSMDAEKLESMMAAAQRLLDARSRLFGLTVLSRVWPHRAELDGSRRTRLISMVLNAWRGPQDDSIMYRRVFEVRLDQRERQVVDGLREGLSTARLARRMHLSPRTVEATISQLLRRFGCANRMELLALPLPADRSESSSEPSLQSS